MKSELIINAKKWAIYLYSYTKVLFYNYYKKITSEPRLTVIALGGLILLLLLLAIIIIINFKSKKKNAAMQMNKEAGKPAVLKEKAGAAAPGKAETDHTRYLPSTEPPDAVINEAESGNENDIEEFALTDEKVHYPAGPSGQGIEGFIAGIKSDLEAEFINLIKRYYPACLNYNENYNISNEVSAKSQNIIERLAKLEEQGYTFTLDYYLAKSLYFLVHNDTVNLEKSLIHTIKLYPRSDLAKTEYGRYLIHKQEYAAAEELLYKTREINPGNLDVYFLLGEIYFKQKKLYDALNMFKKVILIDNQNCLAYAFQGYILTVKGFVSDGEKDLHKAISLNYKNPIPYFLLGNVYKDMKFFGKAIANYKKAIQYNSETNENIELFENTAFCYYCLKEYNIAITKLDTLFRHNSLTPFGLMTLGNCYLELKDHDQAVKTYSALVAKSPEKEHMVLLANSLQKAGNYQQGIEYYKKAIEEKNEVEVNIHIGDIYFNNLSNYSEAEKHYLLAIKKDELNTSAMLKIANVYYKKNDFEKSSQYFQKVHRSDEYKDNPDLYFKNGLCFYKLKNYAEAIKYLVKAETTGYIKEELFSALAFSYLKEGKIHKAIDSYQKALAIDPYNPAVYNNLGAIYAQQENYQQAIIEFKKALKADKDNKQALFNLHKAYKILSEKESDKYLSQLEEVV